MTKGVFKGWVPEPYLDEISPPPRATPSAWLLVGDVVRLAAFDKRDDAAEPGPVLAEGETVRFVSLTTYGSTTIRVAQDGSFEQIGTAPPPAAKQFCARGDSDTLADSLADFAKAEAENGCEDLPAEIEVDCYTWCDGKEYALRGDAFVEVA